MKKILISYGDKNYKGRFEEIRRRAEASGEFDEVKFYGPEFDFPPGVADFIAKYPRGGGFWLWKPLIIRDALMKCSPGDIVVYADAGGTINRHADWNRYFTSLADRRGILFMGSGRNMKWCRREVFEKFSGRPDPSWAWSSPVKATFVIMRKGEPADPESCGNPLIDAWAGTALENPELFADVAEEERAAQNPRFREHRHDQAVLNACLNTIPERKEYIVERDKMEYLYPGGAAYTATRISPVLNRGHVVKKKDAFSDFIDRFLLFPISKMKFLANQR